jgi:glutathione S-transferase
VAELTELVGFRSITTTGSGDIAAPSSSRERIAERVDEFVARRAAMLDRDRLNDPETWLDGDDPQVAAVALPPPQSYV